MSVPSSRWFTVALACAGSSLVACSSSSTDGPDAAVAQNETVLIEGTSAQAAAQEQTIHDSIFTMYEAQAQAAGDLGHSVFLDVAGVGTELHVDTWDNAAGLQQFLANPAVQRADTQLFTGTPTVTITTQRPGWYGWGSYARTQPDGSPAFVALIRGRLASTDEATSQSVHNQGAMGAQAPAQAAGDLAHLVYFDPKDPGAFIVIDEWTNVAGAMALYASAPLQQAFGALLGAPPSVTLYVDQSWVQWP